MASARRRSSLFCLLSSIHAVWSARMSSSAGKIKVSVKLGLVKHSNITDLNLCVGAIAQRNLQLICALLKERRIGKQ